MLWLYASNMIVFGCVPDMYILQALHHHANCVTSTSFGIHQSSVYVWYYNLFKLYIVTDFMVKQLIVLWLILMEMIHFKDKYTSLIVFQRIYAN